MAIAPKTAPIKRKFHCDKCPGWCCSYELIPVTGRDLGRIARHFGLSEEVAARRYTKTLDGELALRHRKDHIYKSMCIFFDQKNRRCGAYEARPTICRTYPSGHRCGYYEFLMFERDQQGDDTFIPGNL